MKEIQTYQFRPQLSSVVPMSKAAIFPQTPAIQLPTGGDGGTVRAATGYVTDALGLQCLNQPRFVTVPKTENQDIVRILPSRCINDCQQHNYQNLDCQEKLLSERWIMTSSEYLYWRDGTEMIYVHL